MGTEIERKFLVESDAWRESATESIPMKQGYFASASGTPTLRVRIADGHAFFTVKGNASGFSRSEFEYEIPVADAEAMFAEFCGDRVIRKIRYLVPGPDGAQWEVDEYFDANAGLVTAELELDSEDGSFVLPGWLGREVSSDRRYSNRSLSVNPVTEWNVPIL